MLSLILQMLQIILISFMLSVILQMLHLILLSFKLSSILKEAEEEKQGRRQPIRAPGQEMIAGPLSKIMSIRDMPMSLSVKFRIKSMHSCTV